uniref:Portal protein n=1 Tax=viral metagenome TaxID=1070528 RepID=A0A6M3KWF4_9ZZZZ
MNRDERNRQIIESNLSPREAAEAFGVSPSTVYRLRREAQGTEAHAEEPPRLSNREMLFDQLSVSGISFHGGTVNEEFQRELQDDGGVNIYTEMSVHPVVSAVLFAIQMAQRQVEWYVEPAGETPQDEEAAKFLEECLFDDMSQTWDDVVSQIYTMLVYGYSAAEIVYKRRLGMDPPAYVEDPAKSMFDDNKIGWRRWQFVSPKSMPAGNRWIFDEHGRVQGFRQQPAPDYQLRTIPMEKALLFRTRVEWDNPEPPPILRPMYQAYYYATNLQEVEAIGAERLGNGLPVIYLGDGCTFSGNNSDFELAKDIVRNVRTDEQMGVVIPRPKMSADGRGILLELLSPPSSGIVNFDDVITRYEQRMAMTALAQFIFIGMSRVGTQSLNESSTDTFQAAIGAWSDSNADVVNRFAIPRLFALNPFNLERLPKLAHSEVSVPDLGGIAQYINALYGAQLLTPDDNLEAHLRKLAGFPEKPEVVGPESPPPQQEPEVEEDEAIEEPPEPDEEASERFALRTRPGNPNWERATNAYEGELRQTYQQWADDTAGQLAGIEDDDEFSETLMAAILALIAELRRLGQRRLPDALQLGLGGVAPSPDGYRMMADAIAENERYLSDSLGPAIAAKVEQQVTVDPLIRQDRESLGGTFGTFLARVASYAGAFWGLIHLGFVNRVKQKDAEKNTTTRVRSVLDPRARHCPQCPTYAHEYDSIDQVIAETGGVPTTWNSDCGPNCRCHLEEEVAPGVWRRMWP